MGSGTAVTQEGGGVTALPAWDPRTDPEPLDGVADLCRRYLDHLTVERGLAVNSLRAYGRDLRRYRAFLAERAIGALDEVSETTLGDFLAMLRTGTEEHGPLSPSSAARTLVTVRGLHRFALREGDVAQDTARPVRPPSAPRRLPKALGVSEVEALLEATGVGDPRSADAAVAGADDPAALRARALLEVLYGTGARISEAVGLDVDDLDLETGTVLLRGKGSKERVVPVGSFARAAVSAWLVRGRPASSRGPPRSSSMPGEAG